MTRGEGGRQADYDLTAESEWVRSRKAATGDCGKVFGVVTERGLPPTGIDFVAGGLHGLMLPVWRMCFYDCY